MSRERQAVNKGYNLLERMVTIGLAAVLLMPLPVWDAYAQKKTEVDQKAAQDRPVKAGTTNHARVMRLSPDIANLPTMIATPWLKIDADMPAGQEGPAFDRAGNLYVCRTAPPPGPDAKILRITPDKKITTFYNAGKSIPVGLAIHKDGRLFFACLSGEILILSTNGVLERTLTPSPKGESLHINDLVFDKKGNLYFTDFRGTVANPVGGVYRLDAADNYAKVNTLYEGMASPNGISLTPEENGLWIAEPGRSALVRLNLMPDGSLAPIAAVAYVYYSTGDQGMDSNKVDAKGNLYQPVMGGGRVLIFDPHGIPVANVLIPGRDQGKSLMSPNLALKPGTNDAYLQAAGPDGTWLYKFKALAPAHKLYSHQ